MSWKAILVSILAGFSTYYSFNYGLLINLRGNNIVSIAVVFPLVFSINAAYQRREKALQCLASLKGHAFSIRLCYAHWSRDTRYTQDILYAADDILATFFEDLKRYLSNEKIVLKLEENVLHAFTALSLLNEKLRLDDVSTPELSKVNEYIRNMIVNFEVMKSIHMYRTPSSIRCYTKFFLSIIPIVYGPVFAYIATESGNVIHGIVLAILYAIVLSALDNTQDALENPCDGMSPDDIQFKRPTAILTNRVSRSLSEILPHIKFTNPSTAANSNTNNTSTSNSGNSEHSRSGGGHKTGRMTSPISKV